MTFVRQRHPFDRSIKKRLMSLRKLDNWHGLVALFYDYAVIAAAIYFFWLTPWAYPVSVILIGSRQRALATILHEAAHQCLVKSSKCAQCSGFSRPRTMILCPRSSSPFRKTHTLAMG